MKSYFRENISLQFPFFSFVVWFLLSELFEIKAKKVLFTLNTYNLRTHNRKQIFMIVLESWESFLSESLDANLMGFF